MHSTTENSVIEINSSKEKKNKKFKSLGKYNFEFMREVINEQYKNISKKVKEQPSIRYTIIIVSMALIFTIIISSLLSSKNQDTSINKNEIELINHTSLVPGLNPINDQLEDISAKLANLEKNLSGNAYVDIDTVRKSVTDLKTQVTDLSQSSNELLTKEIQASTEKLKDELSGIKKELSNLNEQKKTHQYIDVSKLPFKVIDIANIQQSDIVTVSYANKIFPLYPGDAIAGWTVSQASSINQVAEFKNKDENYIQINLNGN